MVAYATRMEVGYAGAVDRTHSCDVEAGILDGSVPANVPTAYGVGLVLDATGYRLPITGDTAISGFYVRPYPTQSSQDPLRTDTAPAASIAGTINVLKRGYMDVKMAGGSAANGGIVYVGVAAPDVPGGIYGATGTGRIALDAKTYFKGAADATYGITQIAYNI